jgi:hypothetical protein
MATIQPGMISWKTLFADADWFHWTEKLMGGDVSGRVSC